MERWAKNFVIINITVIMLIHVSMAQWRLSVCMSDGIYNSDCFVNSFCCGCPSELFLVQSLFCVEHIFHIHNHYKTICEPVRRYSSVSVMYWDNRYETKVFSITHCMYIMYLLNNLHCTEGSLIRMFPLMFAALLCECSNFMATYVYHVQTVCVI